MLRFSHLMCPFTQESSKCGHFRDGTRIVDLPTCPVKALEVYISWLKSNLQRIYRSTGPFATPRSKERVQSQEISYTRARELIKDVLEILPDGSRISVFSLSAGGVTSPANAGVAGRFFKRHGCWASENAKNGYVKDDFNYCLSVAKSLGF